MREKYFFFLLFKKILLIFEFKFYFNLGEMIWIDILGMIYSFMNSLQVWDVLSYYFIT